MIYRLFFVVLVLLSSALAAAEKPVIAVSVQPQQYLLEQIGGQHVNIQLMVVPGRSPVTYDLLPRQMATLSKARLYWSIGVPFENNWLARIRKNYPALRVVDARQALPPRQLQTLTDSQDDPHIWLDPELNLLMADSLRQLLIEMDPGHTDDYNENYRKFSWQIDRLDKRIRASLQDFSGKSFLVFHPAWGYFARAYGLRQIAVEHEGKEPGARYLGELIRQVRKTPVDAIFVQPQQDERLAQVVARALNVQLIRVDPLSKQYLGELLKISSALGRYP